MGFDKNGNWSSEFYPEQDRDNEVPITASKFQTLIQENIKQSFENCILRDGTGLPTANISLNRNKLTNLANGTSEFDGVNKGQLDAAMATNATEEKNGTLRVATQEEALGGEDDTLAITPKKLKSVIGTLAGTTRFCVNSGYAREEKPDLLIGIATPTLSFKVDDGTSYKPLVATTAGGNSFQVNTIIAVDVSGMLDGTYNVFVSPEGTAKVYANKVYRQQSEPTLNTNDIWFNTCEPFKSYIKTAEGLEETDLVQIPQTIMVKSNVISAIETIAYFNDNGSGNTRASDFDYISFAMMPDYTAGITKPWGTAFTAEFDGILRIQTATDYGYAYVKVNGNTMHASGGTADVVISTTTFPVVKGDKVTFEEGQDGIRPGEAFVVFYPYKGVI